MSKLNEIMAKKIGNNGTGFDREQEISNFKSNVESLYKKIYELLESYIKDGSIIISPIEETLYEDTLGDYKINRLHIKFDQEHIELKPVGRVMIGSQGRVDIQGLKNKVKIVLMEDTWKIVDPKSSKLNLLDINEDTLAETLKFIML